MVARRWINDRPLQDYNTSPRGLLDMILVHTRPDFVRLEPRAREVENQRCYRLLPEYRRVQLGQLSRLLRNRPVESVTPRELTFIRLAWAIAFRDNPTLQRPATPPAPPPVRVVPVRHHIPSHLIPPALQAFLRGEHVVEEPPVQPSHQTERRDASQAVSSPNLPQLGHPQVPNRGRGHGRRVFSPY